MFNEKDFTPEELQIVRSFREFIVTTAHLPKELHQQLEHLLFLPSFKISSSDFQSPDSPDTKLQSDSKGDQFDTQIVNSLIHKHIIPSIPRLLSSVNTYDFIISHLSELRNETISISPSDSFSWNLSEDEKNYLQGLLLGRLAIAYNNQCYIIGEIDFNLTPLSSFERRDGDSRTYLEHFTNKGLSIRDIHQPMIVHRSSFHSKNRTSLIILPELCRVTGITAELFWSTTFLPSILIHIDAYLKVHNCAEELLQRGLPLEFIDRRLLKKTLSHPSYANEQEGPLSDYQRLEFIGDSVLNFFCTAKLYFLFPKISHVKLALMRLNLFYSHSRSSLVNNEFLTQLSNQLQLFKWIIFPSKFDHERKGTKVTADVFEALTG